MNQNSVSTSMAPEILIKEVNGNLQLKGWDRPEVVAKANPDDLLLEEKEDVVTISCRGNCVLRVPEGASVALTRASGEARFKLLEDQLSVDEVNGTLMLRSVGETHAASVHGDLIARDIAGDLIGEEVNGNLVARNIQGNCHFDNVHGNLDLRDIDGSIQATTRGNARIRLSMLSEEAYEISANGNVNLRLPENASARLKLNSSGQNIKINLPGIADTYQQEHKEITLGDGETSIEISAHGNIYVSTQSVEWDEVDYPDFDDEGFSDFSNVINRQVTQQIESQMEAMTRQLNEQMASLSASISKAGLSQEQAEQILQQARESSERATARAQEKMRRTQEKLERKLEMARRREELRAQAAERRSKPRDRRWNFEWTGQATQPAPSGPSDEERLMILRMLEQKKISLEEAEQLLSALENHE